LIVGQGGIGSALAEKIKANSDEVFILTRKKNLFPDSLCFEDLDTFLNEFIPDYVINTIGILHDETHMPEKNVSQIRENWLQKSINVNVMSAIILAQALDKYLKRDSILKFMNISARVSSISDNRLGGWYSYRMSKSALNMFVKTLAIEWSRQYPKSAVYAYHPGTVDTELSKPFQKNINPEKLFTPNSASEHLLSVLEKLTVEDSGSMYDWAGEKIAY